MISDGAGGLYVSSRFHLRSLAIVVEREWQGRNWTIPPLGLSRYENCVAPKKAFRLTLTDGNPECDWEERGKREDGRIGENKDARYEGRKDYGCDDDCGEVFTNRGVSEKGRKRRGADLKVGTMIKRLRKCVGEEVVGQRRKRSRRN